MRAYRIPGWEQPPELMEVPVPEPGSGQVLVRVGGNGLCHSDLMMHLMPESLGAALGWEAPFTLGHETAGWVAAIGSDVQGLTEGDPVALVSPNSCGACRACITGRDHLCVARAAGRGYGRDGGLADFVLVEHPRTLVRLGNLDPVHAGPLTDAGATAYHAVSRARAALVPGSSALVIGAGGLGAFAIQFLRVLTAARVLAVDTNPARLDVATDAGAHDAFAGVDDRTAPSVLGHTGGEGAAAVLDFVGTDATIAAGIAATRPGGTFVLIGAAGGHLHDSWYGALSAKDIAVHAFQGSTIAHLHEVLALAESGAVVNPTDDFPLSAVADAYAAMEAGTLRGRAVVIPD
jgi:propanol-preferring alcohol dehydrogenase